jgi:hypothetical protein
MNPIATLALLLGATVLLTLLAMLAGIALTAPF